MTTVMIVADPAVEELLSAALTGADIVTVEPDSAYRRITRDGQTPLDYAVLHDTRFGKRSDDLLYEIVAALREKKIPTAVLLSSVKDDDFKKAVFVANVDVGIDLGEHGERLNPAVDRVARSVAGIAARPASPPPNAHTIGSLVTIELENNSERDGERNKPGTAYRMARWRSLVPLDGSVFSQSVRDVVTELSAFPLRAVYPWDPREREGTAHWPSLRDVLRTFADRESLVNMYAGDTPPLSQAQAVALLTGARVEGESEKHHAEWMAAWAGGQSRPPAVLIDGETGVGKSLMAEFLTFLLTPTRSELKRQGSAHQGLSARDRFVKFNGAALTLNEFSHVLMGTAPGRWSGVDDAVVGLFARAAHGVFLLDEIGDMPLDVQAALLTFLDSREIRPFGVESFSGFQHIIAATNRKLSEDVANESFRKDLLARFSLRLTVPPLRDRSPEDRRRLIDFLAQDPSVNRRRDDASYEVIAIESAAMTRLLEHEYRNGNFRELAQRVHESLRNARRGLRRIVSVDDVPEKQTAIVSASAQKSGAA